jgi:ElaB/YqjD/DUF883 family membrane-anchored ribosome-binding protein
MTEATEASAQEGLTDQASATVQDAASAAQQKASELREQGEMRLRNQFDQRSHDAGAQVRVLAEALRRSGSDLSNKGNTSGARLAEQAADRIERVGSYLEQRRGDELVRDIEMFARRRPWMLAGLGMLAGFAAARFMKASSEQRYGDYRRTNDQQWPMREGTAGSGAYGRGELARGGYEADTPVVGSDVPSASSDDSPARDPRAGAR